MERLHELRDVLPRMQVIAEQRNEVHKTEEKAKEWTKQRQKHADELTRRDHALKLARDKKTSTQGLIDADAARQREASALLRQRSIQLEKLKEFERHEGDLERVREEKKRLPDDPAAAVARARESFEALTALAQIVPQLARLAARRDDLGQARERGRKARQERETVEAKGIQIKAELEKIRPRLQEGEEALRQAADQAAETRTVVQQARDSLKELTRLDGSKVCRHCGQTLTEGHLKEEKRRRTSAVAEAEAKLKQATQVHQAAQQRERQTRTEHDQAETARQDLRVEYQALKEKADQAGAEASRLQEECGQIYGELSPAFRTRIAPSLPSDWTATAYPASADLAALCAEASGLSAARQLLQQAEQVRDQWHRLATQEAAKLQELTRLRKDLPNEPQEVRREHARLEAEEKSLEKNLAARRLELKEAEADLERLTKEREQAQAELGRCEAALKQQEFLKQEAQKTLTRTRTLLPPAWQAAAEKVGTSELFDWKGEMARLEEARIDERGASCTEPGSTATYCGETGMSWRGRRRRSPPRRGRSRRRWRNRCRRPGLGTGRAKRSCAKLTVTRTSWTPTGASGRKSRRNTARRTASWRCSGRWPSCWARTGCNCIWCGRRSGRWWSTPTPYWIGYREGNCI